MGYAWSFHVSYFATQYKLPGRDYNVLPAVEINWNHFLISFLINPCCHHDTPDSDVLLPVAISVRASTSNVSDLGTDIFAFHIINNDTNDARHGR